MAAAVAKLGLGIVLKIPKVAILCVLMFFCLFLLRPKRFLQWGNFCQPRPIDFFGDKVRFSLRAAFSGDFARICLIGGFEQGEPVRELRVGRVFAVQADLRIGNADVLRRRRSVRGA